MLELSGPPALSVFRIAKLLTRIRELEAGVSGVSAHFVHFADLVRALTAAERDMLMRLLSYGPAADETPGGDDTSGGCGTAGP